MVNWVWWFLIPLWKESLSNDSQQYHQYQQNERPSLTSNHWTQKSMTYAIGNPGSGFGQTHKFMGLNQLMGFEPSPFNKRFSNSNNSYKQIIKILFISSFLNTSTVLDLIKKLVEQKINHISHNLFGILTCVDLSYEYSKIFCQIWRDWQYNLKLAQCCSYLK